MTQFGTQALGGDPVSRRRTRAFALLAAAGLAVSATPAAAGPDGARVVSGSATITGGAHTRIHASDGAIINYDRFNVGAAESVTFVQPDAASRVLNRVTSGGPSQIDGGLFANGQVYLLNPAGVVFGPGSVVDVGRLVAAAGQMSDADFAAGVDRFTDLSGTIEHHGSTRASFVGFFGRDVINSGSVETPDGTFVVATGDSVSVYEGLGSLRVVIDASGPGAHLPGLSAGDAATMAAFSRQGLSIVHDGSIEIRGGEADGTATGEPLTVFESDIEAAAGLSIEATGSIRAQGVFDVNAGTDGGQVLRIEGGDLSLVAGTGGAGGSVDLASAAGLERVDVVTGGATLIAGVAGDGAASDVVLPGMIVAGATTVSATGDARFAGVSSFGGEIAADATSITLAGALYAFEDNARFGADVVLARNVAMTSTGGNTSSIVFEGGVVSASGSPAALLLDAPQADVEFAHAIGLGGPLRSLVVEASTFRVGSVLTTGTQDVAAAEIGLQGNLYASSQSGIISYDGAVALERSAAFTSAGGSSNGVTLGGTIAAAPGAASPVNALVDAGEGPIMLGGDLGVGGPFGSLAAEGGSISIARVLTLGSQSYTGDVTVRGSLVSCAQSGTIEIDGSLTLAADSAFATAGGSLDSITITGPINGADDGAFALLIDAGEAPVNLGDAIGGVGALRAFAAGGSTLTLGDARVAASLDLSDIDALTLDASSLVLGEGGALSLPTGVVLRSGISVTGPSVDFTMPEDAIIADGGASLTVDLGTAGVFTAGSGLGTASVPLDSLDIVAGTVTVNGAVTSANQSISGSSVTLGGGEYRSLAGGALAYDGSILLTADTVFDAASGPVRFGGSVNGPFAVRVDGASIEIDAEVGNGSPVGSLTLSGGSVSLGAITAQSLVDTTGVSQAELAGPITVGGGGSIRLGQSTRLLSSVSLAATGGTISSTGVISGSTGAGLSATTGSNGSVAFGGDLGSQSAPLGAVTVQSGPASFSNVHTSGTISVVSDGIALEGDRVAGASGVTLEGDITAAADIAIATETGDVVIDGMFEGSGDFVFETDSGSIIFNDTIGAGTQPRSVTLSGPSARLGSIFAVEGIDVSGVERVTLSGGRFDLADAGAINFGPRTELEADLQITSLGGSLNTLGAITAAADAGITIELGTQGTASLAGPLGSPDGRLSSIVFDGLSLRVAGDVLATSGVDINGNLLLASTPGGPAERRVDPGSGTLILNGDAWAVGPNAVDLVFAFEGMPTLPESNNGSARVPIVIGGDLGVDANGEGRFRSVRFADTTAGPLASVLFTAERPSRSEGRLPDASPVPSGAFAIRASESVTFGDGHAVVALGSLDIEAGSESTAGMVRVGDIAAFGDLRLAAAGGGDLIIAARDPVERPVFGLPSDATVVDAQTDLFASGALSLLGAVSVDGDGGLPPEVFAGELVGPLPSGLVQGAPANAPGEAAPPLSPDDGNTEALGFVPFDIALVAAPIPPAPPTDPVAPPDVPGLPNTPGTQPDQSPVTPLDPPSPSGPTAPEPFALERSIAETTPDADLFAIDTFDPRSSDAAIGSGRRSAPGDASLRAVLGELGLRIVDAADDDDPAALEPGSIVVTLDPARSDPADPDREDAAAPVRVAVSAQRLPEPAARALADAFEAVRDTPAARDAGGARSLLAAAWEAYAGGLSPDDERSAGGFAEFLAAGEAVPATAIIALRDEYRRFVSVAAGTGLTEFERSVVADAALESLRPQDAPAGILRSLLGADDPNDAVDRPAGGPPASVPIAAPDAGPASNEPAPGVTPPAAAQADTAAS